jgi:hypothetical protein
MLRHWRMGHQLKNKNDGVLTGIIREQYLVEWLFLSILWIVSALCAYIFCANLLMLPQLGPPYTPSPDITPWQWLFLAVQHPFVYPAAIATVIALTLVIVLTTYFALWLPSRVDSTLRLELRRIGLTTKQSFRRRYVTRIDSKGTLITRLLPKTTGSGEYGLVVLRATLPDISPDKLRPIAQRYFLALDQSSLATVCSLDELHFKVTQLARALDEL